MRRTSTLTKKAEAEIERLTAEGDGSRVISKALLAMGIRAINGSEISRHQVGRYQRKLKEEAPPPPRSTEPHDSGEGEASPPAHALVEVFPAGQEPTHLPGILTPAGDPSTTRIERAEGIRWLRALLGAEIPLVVERIEGGGARLRRCNPEDPCGLSDTRRLDHLSRSTIRFDKVLKSAETERTGAVAAALASIKIDIHGLSGPSKNDEDGSRSSPTSGLLPADLIALLDEHLLQYGSSWDKFLEGIGDKI